MHSDTAAAAVSFLLQFSTGQSATISGAGLLGRRPAPQPGEYFDSLITLVDPGRSVSKTHLEFGVDDSAFWILDRYSGNGTVVRFSDGGTRRSEPGKRLRVPRGSRVEIGDQFFLVI